MRERPGRVQLGGGREQRSGSFCLVCMWSLPHGPSWLQLQPEGRGKGGRKREHYSPPTSLRIVCVILEVDISRLHSSGQNLSHVVESSCQGGKGVSCSRQPWAHLEMQKKERMDPGGELAVSATPGIVHTAKRVLAVTLWTQNILPERQQMSVVREVCLIPGVG